MGKNIEVDLNGAAEVAHGPCSETGGSTTRVIGYASCVRSDATAALELKEQAEVITTECRRRGFELVELVGERAPATGKGLSRPGLSYALDRIKAREASGLLVVELSRITQSVGELGTIMEWLRA
ncbi:MAG: recombinase family protein, partial [Solirubrobacteraceae bacterium]